MCFTIVFQVVNQSLASWVDFNFKLQAYALILLREAGHPCVFYGDLYPNNEGYDPGIAHRIKLLMAARKNYAYGPTRDYFEYYNLIGFVRLGDTNHKGCAVVLSNSNATDSGAQKTIRMNVGLDQHGKTYQGLLEGGADLSVVIDSDGWGTFSCTSNHVQVWVEVD